MCLHMYVNICATHTYVYWHTHTHALLYICLAVVCRRLLSIDESRPFAHCLNLRCDLPVLCDFCCCCAFRSYWFCINCDACVSAFAFYWFANKYSTFKILILKHVLSVRWLAAQHTDTLLVVDRCVQCALSLFARLVLKFCGLWFFGSFVSFHICIWILKHNKH